MAKRIYGSTPKQDGFRMPGEFEPQAHVFMVWPQRTDNWRQGAKPAQRAFTEVANIFPITPSSTIAEKVDAWAANGKKILPGDTLEIHVELLSERAEKAIATCKCAVYTAGDLAAETGGTITMR